MTAKWQYKQAYEAAIEEVQALKAENDKLRELVRHMLTCDANTDYGGSPMCDVCPYDMDGDRSACGFKRRAQELGIEVKDD